MNKYLSHRYFSALLFFMGITLVTISKPLLALGSCSSYTGQAVLNEFYHNNQSLSPNSYFVETKALNFALVDNGDYQNWSITLCSQQAVDDGVTECISGDSAFAAANANTTYEAGLSLANASWPSDKNNWILVDQADWTNDHGYIDLNDGGGHGMEALLLDGNGDLIDYLSVDSYSTHIGTTYTTCSLTQTSYEGGSNTFDIQRVPDGTGPWAKNPGNSGDQTAVDTNETLPPPPAGDTYPELTIDSFLVSQDADAVFTIRFNVEDPFSEDVTISYETFEQTATAGVGNDYTAVSGTITIPVGQTFASVSVDTLPTSTPDEYFYLVLTDITSDNATILNAVGMATITGKPTITSITTSCDEPNQISVLFGEPITAATAETVGNYALDNEATISAAILQGDQQTVLLTTSTLSSIVYTLTVNNIDDTDSPTETIAANSQKTFKHNCGPVAYYKMDEEYWTGTAGEIVDSSGNGLNGTAVGGVTTSLAKVCNGAMLDGVNLAYGEVSDNALLDIDDELTVSLWLKTNIIPSSGLKSILSKDENYEFHIDSGGHIYWWWNKAGGGAYTLTSSQTLTVGTWHHVAIVYSKSGSYQKIFIDGVEDPISTNRSESLMLNSDPLQFGGDQFFASREFDGLLDEIRIYSRALTQGEIQSDMNASHSCAQLACGFRDKFTNAAFDNNDGFLSFASDWVETNDNGSASSGDAYITNGELVMTNRGRGSQPQWTRQLDLTGASSATLAFTFRTDSGVDNSDAFRVRVSNDGGANWTTLETINGIRGSSYEARNYDISGFISNQTQIRLEISSRYTGSNEYVYFYQLSVNAPDLCVLVDHYAISHSTPGVTCEASAITITPHDSNDAATIPSASTTITISTTPTADGLSVKSAANALTDNGNGTYDYTFDGSETSVEFWMTETTATAAIDIDVTDGSASDPDDGGYEDPPIQFLDSAFRFYADGTADSIGTQISGKPSGTAPGNQTLILRAVQTNTDTGACEAALTGTTAINIAYECNNPTTCSGTDLLSFTGAATITASRNNSGAALNYTPVNMTFDASGTAPFSFTFSDAGQITLHASKTLVADGSTAPPTSAATLIGSSNSFVTRPFGFDLDFNTNNRATDWGDNGALDGSTGDPSYATDATGSIFTTAGSNFDMTIRSVLWEATDDGDSDGIPDDRSNLTGNGVTPNFSGVALYDLDFSFYDQVSLTTSIGGPVSPTFNTGIATQLMSWPEVGVMDIGVTHSSYLGDASADVTATAFDVGRFTPASFIVTLNNTPSFTEQVSGTFTYLGQDFVYGTAPQVTIQAVAADGVTVTQNYEGNYWMLGADITPTYTDLAGVTDSGGGAITLTAPGAAVGFGDTSNVNGQVTLTLHSGLNFSYARPGDNDTVNPFDADVRLNLAALDSDSISGTLTPTAFSQHLGFSTDTELGSGNALSGTNDQTIRLGRALLVDGYASAGNPATMPLTLEFFDGTSFVNNAADAATAFTDTLLSCSDPLGGATIACADITITPADPATVSNGNFFTLSPGNNNEGTLTYQLSLAASTFLQFDWDGDGIPNNDPDASITFGQYRDYHGDERFIYWREVESP